MAVESGGSHVPSRLGRTVGSHGWVAQLGVVVACGTARPSSAPPRHAWQVCDQPHPLMIRKLLHGCIDAHFETAHEIVEQARCAPHTLPAVP